MKSYLAVPFEEKDEAKLLGAKWDTLKRKWYAPYGETDLVQKWPRHDEALQELVGEDVTYGGNQLYVDLLPKPCWGVSRLYNLVHPSERDRLKDFIVERAHSNCECCDNKGPLDAHERWDFNETTKTQKLMRIIALCKPCHESTHMGLAQWTGREKFAVDHLMKVRQMDDDSAKQHVKAAFELQEQRNGIAWELDLSILVNSGIKLVDKHEKEQRNRLKNANVEIEKSLPLGTVSAQIGIFGRSASSVTMETEPQKSQEIVQKLQ